MLAGPQLKTLRNQRNITVREVEQASRRIADVKGDKRFCISNGWLAQLENGVSEPSICKLFSLSVIYRANFLELVRLYNVDVDDKAKYEPVADPSITQLITHKTNTDDEVNSNSSETSLIAPMNGSDHAPKLLHAHLGLADFTMYPMIRPGALLTIDPAQNKLVTEIWRNEYERPIYFIELRDAYACGWCELQGNQLLIIPHYSSTASVRRLTYPKEAEIAGRVISYSTGCVDLKANALKSQKRKAIGRANTT